MVFVKSCRLFRTLCVLTILYQCIVVLSHQHVHSHSHEHDHAHSHHGHAHEEPPSFKYTQQANAADNTDAKHTDGHSHSNNIDDNDVTGTTGNFKTADSGQVLWLYALGSTAMISAAPILILFFIPLDKSESHRPRLKVLLSFASGGLLGDAFLHLIPHAIMAQGGDHGHSHSHSHGHSHGDTGEGHAHDLSVGLWVLAGVVAFLIVEKFVRYVKGEGHSHGHSHGSKPLKSSETKTEGSSNVKASTTDTVKESKSEKSAEEGAGIVYIVWYSIPVLFELPIVLLLLQLIEHFVFHLI